MPESGIPDFVSKRKSEALCPPATCLHASLTLLVVGPSLVAYGGVIGSEVGLSVFQVCRCLRPLGQGAFQARLVAVTYSLA